MPANNPNIAEAGKAARQYPSLVQVLFFGDGEYNFKLTIQGLSALQSKVQSGVGQIYARVLAGAYYDHDLIETVRHGLIGGGLSPKEASDLIRDYGEQMPLDDWHRLASEILSTAMHGYQSEEDGGTTANTSHETDEDGFFDIAQIYGAAMLSSITPAQVNELTLWEVQRI